MRSIGLQFLLLFAIHGGVFFFPCESLLDVEVSALMALKRDILEDPLAVLSDWNALGGEPCNWFGVVCSETQNHVVILNLSSSSLKGFLSPELGLLSSLQELNLNNNLFFGTIPKQIGMLKNLAVLDLSVNRLSGPIPTDLGNLTSITKINLHYNGLTGCIPPVFAKLSHLVELRLDRNRLIGSILGNTSSDPNHRVHNLPKPNNNGNDMNLCHFPWLRIGDFSYNFLVGKVPSCLKYLPRSSFQGNCLQDEYTILQRTSQICGFSKRWGVANGTSRHSSEEPKHRKLQQPEWLLILEACTMSLFFITVVATVYAKCKRKPYIQFPWKRNTNWRKHVTVSIDGEMLKGVNSFSREELELACEDFSNIIGSSPDSIVYKGTMMNGPEIAVISLCILKDQWTDYLELYFHNKVADLARLNHENTAKLLGYCKQNNPFSRMLVFDYASNGTLYEHLHYGEGCQLSWFRRMKISLGIAHSLRYLHTELHPPFALTELNSGSVYLTEDFTPKLVDFESWKMVLSKSENNSGQISGGYYFNSIVGSSERQLAVQCNTYAFGVLLLEIISRRHSFCKERGCLVDWELVEMDTDTLLGHRHSKFRQLGGFREAGHVEPEIRRNMKKKDVAVSEITANLEAELEELKKSVLKTKEITPFPVFSNDDVELVKRDVDKEITNAFIAMGLKEKLEALKMDLSKAPSDQNLSPTLKDRVERLVQEFRNNLSSSPTFDGLKKKLKTLSEINMLQEHKRKGEILKKSINDQLQDKAKERMEILRKARNLAAKGEELDDDTLEGVNKAKDELIEMLKSANFEVVGVNRKITSSAPPVLLEKVTKANEVIFSEIEKVVEMGGLRSKLDELRLEIGKGSGKDKNKVESLIKELRDGVRASLDENELEKMVKSSVGLPSSPDPVEANAEQM